MPRTSVQTADLSIYTYGIKVPRDYPVIAKFTINVSGLRDPQSNRGFKKKYTDGRAGEIQEYIREDRRWQAIRDEVEMLAFQFIKSEARTNEWLSLAIADHHGKWIAPAVGESLADYLSDNGYRVSLYHHDVPNVVIEREHPSWKPILA